MRLIFATCFSSFNDRLGIFYTVCEKKLFFFIQFLLLSNNNDNSNNNNNNNNNNKNSVRGNKSLIIHDYHILLRLGFCYLLNQFYHQDD